MRIFFFYIIALLVFISCSPLKKQPDLKAIFTPQETSLIMSGSYEKPMRVLLITNPADSLILRTPSVAFKVDAQDKVLIHFVERMYHTVTDSLTRGVGIAAPQVGILKRIIWVKRLDLAQEPFQVYFNPEIKKYSDLKQDVREGCLSIPDYRATTQDRSYAIYLEYDDKTGSHKCEMVEAFTAAIFQHEIDHLNGIMFTDHLLKEKLKSVKHKIE